MLKIHVRGRQENADENIGCAQFASFMHTLRKRVPAIVSVATIQESCCESECLHSVTIPKLTNSANAFFAILQYTTAPFC
jgi:3-polyprenyl-4-hydroxybenzoate decarboxylase